jgi:hypothetical protein
VAPAVPKATARANDLMSAFTVSSIHDETRKSRSR